MVQVTLGDGVYFRCGLARALCCLMALLLIAGVTACGSGNPTSQFDAELPHPGGLDRLASASVYVQASGKQAIARSPETVAQGSTLRFQPESGMSWAVYRLEIPAGGEPAQNVTFEIEAQATSEYWAGITDFQTNAWRFDGPYNEQADIDLTAGEHTSSAGYVYLAVVVNAGEHALLRRVYSMYEGNDPPNVVLTAEPQRFNPGDPVTLDASESTDPEGDPIQFDWDIGNDGDWEILDGEPVQTVNKSNGFQASVRVMDDKGAAIQGTITVYLNYPPSVSLYAAPRWGMPGSPVTMQASASDYDDGISKYEWDFDGDGSFEVNTGTTPFATRQLPTPAGIVLAAVRVTDSLGAATIKTVKLSSEVNTSPFTPVVVESGVAFASPKVEEVNGRPAIALGGNTVPYYTSLHYVRSLDSDGATWPELQTVADTVYSRHLDLKVIAGRPALVSYLNSGGSVLYWHAQEPEGDNWPSPLQIGGFSPTNLQLLLADGYPTICNFSYFRRALDPEGSSWAQALTFQDMDTHNFAVVAGNPACAGYAFSASRHAFLRAQDPGGLIWPAETELLPLDTESDSFSKFQLTDATGLPGVAGIGRDHAADTYRLLYYHGLDSEGSQWNDPVLAGELPTGEPNVYYFPSYQLHTVNGYPAMVVHDQLNYKILYYLASATDGSSWNAPVTVDCNGAEQIYLDLDTVNGVPVVVYSTEVSILGGYNVVKYIRLE